MKMINLIKTCPKFDNCSASLCPLDEDTDKRVYYSEDIRCPFTIKSKNKSEKGIRTIAPDNVLKVIFKKNQRMLNTRNLNKLDKINIGVIRK